MQVEPWMQLFRIAICFTNHHFLGLMFLFFKFDSWTLATAVQQSKTKWFLDSVRSLWPGFWYRSYCWSWHTSCPLVDAMEYIPMSTLQPISYTGTAVCTRDQSKVFGCIFCGLLRKLSKLLAKYGSEWHAHQSKIDICVVSSIPQTWLRPVRRRLLQPSPTLHWSLQQRDVAKRLQMRRCGSHVQAREIEYHLCFRLVFDIEVIISYL